MQTNMKLINMNLTFFEFMQFVVSDLSIVHVVKLADD